MTMAEKIRIHQEIEAANRKMEQDWKEKGMKKWYVEFKAYGKPGHMGGIKANSGNEAIEVVRAHVIGINSICGVWHDDDEEEQEVQTA